MSRLRRFFQSPAPTIIKYSFTLALALFAFWKVNDGIDLFLTILELMLVFFACNALAKLSRIAASILSSILLLLIDVQMLFLVFSNAYLSLVMVTNVDSLEDLSGKIVVYLAAVLVMAIFVFMPIRHLHLRAKRIAWRLDIVGLIFILVVCAEVIGIDLFGLQKSPLGAYITLSTEYAESVQVAEELKKQPNTTLEFYREGIDGFVEKPQNLPEKPNIILIFCEGLSQNVIDDERNIMVNVRDYQNKTLSFTNYFNHTFATYRGLQGQLYSGYQHNNYDANTLISLPQILENQGYVTRFINVETSNRDFYKYLNTLGFQEVLDYPDGEHKGMVKGHLSDKQSYEKLFEEMNSLSTTGQPFLLSMYTVGTHASFDAMDERFGDGEDSEINKFYDSDAQFGAFMQKFTASPLHENTMVVFTTDHCSYADMYYKDSFPNYERPHVEVDKIPLFIYYKGVTPQQVDVRGRNSLDMAPTLLDYLDVSAPNYFIGTSLFAPLDQAPPIETYFTDGSAKATTTNAVIKRVDAADVQAQVTIVQHYYAAKRQEPLTPDQVENYHPEGDEPTPHLQDELGLRINKTQHTLVFKRMDEPTPVAGPPAPTPPSTAPNS